LFLRYSTGGYSEFNLPLFPFYSGFASTTSSSNDYSVNNLSAANLSANNLAFMLVVLLNSLGVGDTEGDRLDEPSGDTGLSEIGLSCTELGLRGGSVRLRKEEVCVLERLNGILGVVCTSF